MGVMINLFFSHLKESNEENGIVFGDMILEEAGRLIRAHCRQLTEITGWHTVAMRLNRDEFVLWLENQSREQAAEFIEALIKKLIEGLNQEMFSVDVFAGLICTERNQTTEADSYGKAGAQSGDSRKNDALFLL